MSNVIAYGVTDRDYAESPFPERVIWYKTFPVRGDAQQWINDNLQMYIDEECEDLPDLIAVPFVVATGENK